MGRYDKIKVYDGNAWVTPKHLRIWNGSNYTDLGLADSDNITPLYVYEGPNVLHRVTLNKKVNTVIGEQYIDGPWTLLPEPGYCWNWTAANMVISGTIRRVDSSSKRIYYSGHVDRSSYIEIFWEADGRIRVSSRYNNGAIDTRYSSNAVTAVGTWVSFQIIRNQSSNSQDPGVIIWNGVQTRFWSAAFEVGNASNQVGAVGLHFKDNFTCQGRRAGYGTCYFNKDVGNISGTDYSTYAYVTHVDTSREEIIWE